MSRGNKSDAYLELKAHVGIAYNEADRYFSWLAALADGSLTADEVVAQFRIYDRPWERIDHPRCPVCHLFIEHEEERREDIAA